MNGTPLKIVPDAPGPCAILVVDDEPAVRQLIIDALKQAGNYLTAEAADGYEALEALQSSLYDMVITDIHMPGMNGMDLLTRIRELNPGISVIMITAYPSVDLSVSAMRTGAVDFIPKPFQIDDLLFKVNICLRERTLLSDDDVLQGMEQERLRNTIRKISKKGYIYDYIERLGVSNDNIFRIIADLALKISGGDHCSILLYDREADEFLPKFSGATGAPPPHAAPWFKKTLLEVVRKKQGMLHNDPVEGRVSMLFAPLMIRTSVFGILTLTKTRKGNTFSDQDLQVVQSLAKRASLNLENKVLYETLYTNLAETFKGLVTSIQARDNYTERHSENVAVLTVRTAEAMACSADEIECLKIAAMLHDIGKIAVPDRILLKPDELSGTEYEIIKTHSTIGDNILTPIALFEKERRVIRHHHENWDGSGYPDGLSGDDIPLLSRLIAVADAYDAMTSNRPYRKSLSHGAAVDELNRNSGTQFDPQVIRFFTTVLHKP